MICENCRKNNTTECYARRPAKVEALLADGIGRLGLFTDTCVLSFLIISKSVETH